VNYLPNIIRVFELNKIRAAEISSIIEIRNVYKI
jgi:hypothetical protein